MRSGSASQQRRPTATRVPPNTASADTRHFFITDAVLNGLPPHIAQVIAGHRDINVTMGYKAVYPDEAIEAHRAFIARSRHARRMTRAGATRETVVAKGG
jgi:integrase